MVESLKASNGDGSRYRIVADDSEEDEYTFYNPMEEDFARDVGFLNENDAGKTKFKEGRTKDVPCQFHDGFSGTCWKKSTCVYGHDLYTGGVFAKNHPEIAFAASTRQNATSVSRLVKKPALGQENQFVCRVTHVVNPSEFFIEATAGHQCFCRSTAERFLKLEMEEQLYQSNLNKPPHNEQLEAYTYGFNCCEVPEGFAPYDQTEDGAAPKKFQTRHLHNYLQHGFRFRNYQSDIYFENVELVAAKVEKLWMRALVLMWFQGDIKNYGVSAVRVQLLDTGEKLTLSTKDVCKLPEQFLYTPAAAFRCCTFGVSPTYVSWSKLAIQTFKELVENKELLLIVKEGASQDNRATSVFEKRPYVVKLIVMDDGKYTDVAQVLVEKGLGFQWNPFPYRPFIKQVINPSAFDAIYQTVKDPLPAEAIQTENKRLEFLDMCSYKLLKKPKKLDKYSTAD